MSARPQVRCWLQTELLAAPCPPRHLAQLFAEPPGHAGGWWTGWRLRGHLLRARLAGEMSLGGGIDPYPVGRGIDSRRAFPISSRDRNISPRVPSASVQTGNVTAAPSNQFCGLGRCQCHHQQAARSPIARGSSRSPGWPVLLRPSSCRTHQLAERPQPACRRFPASTATRGSRPTASSGPPPPACAGAQLHRQPLTDGVAARDVDRSHQQTTWQTLAEGRCVGCAAA